ncbi:MAG: CPBP family intramembrane metalloprotease [Bacteroidales bacterium]|nr:CPBP family intramembrane metalloprotease [Bacteroidales bacterium]
MRSSIFSNTSGIGQLALLIVFTIASVLIFALIGVAVGYASTGVSITAGLDYANLSEADILYLKILQIFQSFGLFIVPPFLALVLFGKQSEDYFYFNSSKSINYLLAGVLMLVAVPFINATAMWNQQMIWPDFMKGLSDWMTIREEQAAELTKHFLKASHISAMFFNLFIMAVLPAIGEELMFRGVIQKLMTRISGNLHWGIWITAFLFSAIHFQFFTFLPRFLMGAAFGYMLIWSKSIWLPIIAHFVNNGSAIVLNYMVQNKGMNESMENIGTEDYGISFIISMLLISGIIFYFYKNRLKTEV